MKKTGIYLSIYQLSIYLFNYLSIYSTIYLFYPSIITCDYKQPRSWWRRQVSICMPIYLFNSLYNCLSIHPSTCHAIINNQISFLPWTFKLSKLKSKTNLYLCALLNNENSHSLKDYSNINYYWILKFSAVFITFLLILKIIIFKISQ